MGRRVERTRNLGEWTESMYWSRIRSALRQAFRYWKPAIQAKNNARRIYKGKERRRYEYQCAECKNWFKDKDVEIDHIEPAGSLKGYDDLVEFLKRLTPENPDSFQVLCKNCHRKKTNKERKKK